MAWMVRVGALYLTLALATAAGPVAAGPLEDGIAAAYRGDYGTAFKLWKPVAEAGDPIAQNNLASLYSQGLGVKKDPVEAVKWYRAAADQGLPDAESNLGFQYETGAGVDQDYQAALLWYRRGAADGSMEAQFSLGLLYEKGMGVPKDNATAFMWLALASAKGETEARKALSALIPTMTADELAQGRKLQLDYQNQTRPKAAGAPPSR